jgi:hypothetical protein
MRRSALPILVVACAIVAAVLAWLVVKKIFASSPEYSDEGPVASEIRTPGAFTKIDASGHMEIELVQGPRHEVTVEASPGDQDRIRTRVDGRTLEISADGRSGWRPLRASGRLPRIVVTAPNFESIASAGTIRIKAGALDVPSLRLAGSGATTVRIEKLTTDSLRIAGSGALKAELAGKARELTISLSGAGDVRAGELVTEDGKVSVAGAGSVVVNAEKTLRVSLSGAGTVEYYGNPELKQSVSGLGRIKRRDGTPANGSEKPVRFQVA